MTIKEQLGITLMEIPWGLIAVQWGKTPEWLHAKLDSNDFTPNEFQRLKKELGNHAARMTETARNLYYDADD